MKRKDIHFDLRRLPNGFALDVGNKKYMYFNIEELLGGLMLHLGCEESEYIDRNDLDGIMTACATWPDVKDAYKTIARMSKHAEELMKQIRQLQAEKSILKNSYAALREEYKKLKQQSKTKRL